MGMLAWIATGIVVAIVAKLAARAWNWNGSSPSLLASLGGAVLGGFIVDLTIRGDSVTRLNPTTVVGAIVGSVVLVIIGVRFGRSRVPSGLGRGERRSA